MPVPTWIARKRDGGALDDDAVRAIIDGASRGVIPDYQISALLMAIVWRGMSPRELAVWLDAMVASGDRLKLESVAGTKVDKHSTGGVGDKISLCLAPLVAACGVPVPMMSGRSLGHTGGTLDKLEAIPGFRTALSPREFERVLAKTGLVLAGQSARLAPADKILYALRDATGTVESIPLIASSILSKKIAEGADALVMDVKVGSGAFLPERARARMLARTIVDLGGRAGLRVIALLTAMDQPIGRAVGNACELAEAIEILRGGGPADTRALTVRLGAEMLVLGGRARDGRIGAALIEGAISSGAGLERFRKCVALQGGDVRVIDDVARLPRARRTKEIRARTGGWVTRVDAGLVGRGATALGAGRLRKEDRVDAGVGIQIDRKVGDEVRRGDRLATVHYTDAARWAVAGPMLEQAFVVGPRAPRVGRLVLETIV
ncbi:MAG: thymidine phosphorylase [Deltaproteobacteria bacterium]|nr:thymidine phosphorylase [Deltaproteobacteria bacterium]